MVNYTSNLRVIKKLENSGKTELKLKEIVQRYLGWGSKVYIKRVFSYIKGRLPIPPFEKKG